MKTCRLCNVVQEQECFYKGEYRCKSCCIKRSLKYNKDHREQCNVNMKRYAERHPEKMRQHELDWNNRNRERRRMINRSAIHRRRAKLAGCAEISASTDEMTTLKNDASECAMCGCEFDSVRFKTFEHIVPISLGGSNALDNLAITCWPCNTRRPRNTLDWFAA